MNAFLCAFWAETLKARRSIISVLTAAGYLILPLVAGLFMVILKDPERARAIGLISVKAQLAGGVADWPTFLGMLIQGAAIGGAVLLAIITAWVFGREFSDRTAKELLALPTPRVAIAGAKFVLTGLWALGLTILIFAAGLGVGMAVDIPGWSVDLGWRSFWLVLTIAALTWMLLSLVALFASVGRGYLPPIGWAFLTLVLAQIAAVLGWGDWFPWSVPALLSGMAGTRAEQIGMHSYIVVSIACIAGIAATIAWWRSADQTR